MRTDDCRSWRERIGALVLGQLDRDERSATEAHLEDAPPVVPRLTHLRRWPRSSPEPTPIDSPRPPPRPRASATASPGGSRPSVVTRAAGA